MVFRPYILTDNILISNSFVPCNEFLLIMSSIVHVTDVVEERLDIQLPADLELRNDLR